jgi:hypothetical protein
VRSGAIVHLLSVFFSVDLAPGDHALLGRPEAQPIASERHLEKYRRSINGLSSPVPDVMMTASLGVASLRVMQL